VVDKSIINQSFKYRGIAWVTWFDIATLGPEERPMGRRVAAFSSTSQPASQPTSQPANRLSYKIFKLEYLSNHLSDLPQILNLSLIMGPNQN
jgi:hypothetical protein